MSISAEHGARRGQHPHQVAVPHQARLDWSTLATSVHGLLVGPSERPGGGSHHVQRRAALNSLPRV